MGAKLRAEREKHGFSLRELARRLELSPSALSQIETGRSRPSVSTLYAIVTELGMSLDELFGGSAQRRPSRPPSQQDGREPRVAADSGPVQRADSRRTLELESGVRWERLTATPDPNVDFLFVVYEVGGASSGGGLTSHSGIEYGLVLRGRLTVTIGFDQHELDPGDSISFQSSAPHRLANEGEEPVHAVWLVIGRQQSDPRTFAFNDKPKE